MHKILLVGLGGFIGAVLRYLVSGVVQALTHSISFPFGTLAVNISGCFLIGMFSYLFESQSGMTSEMRMVLMVGILGAFTTFSTFSNETFTLIQDQRLFLASLNVVIHVVLGLAAVILGRFILVAMWR